MAHRHGRHTPAFLLLFLDEKPDYGGSLLHRMESEMPFCFADSASVYRCLQDMEKHDLVQAEWKTDGPGRPQKWYTITEAGREALEHQAEDIHMRRANLEYFESCHPYVEHGAANHHSPTSKENCSE
jgi:PadR family transcriptional regulator PadR